MVPSDSSLWKLVIIRVGGLKKEPRGFFFPSFFLVKEYIRLIWNRYVSCFDWQRHLWVLNCEVFSKIKYDKRSFSAASFKMVINLWFCDYVTNSDYYF